MPVSSLTCTGTSCRDRPVADDELEPRLASLASIARRAEDDDARSRQDTSEGQSLGHVRDAQGRRARVRRGPGHVGRAVSVAVGLDDRPELGVAEQAPEVRDVLPHARRSIVISERGMEHPRQRLDDVAGHEAASVVDRHRGVRVRRRSCCGSYPRLEPLGEKRSDDPGEHVSRAGRRQGRPPGQTIAPGPARRRAFRSLSAGRRIRIARPPGRAPPADGRRPGPTRPRAGERARPSAA